MSSYSVAVVGTGNPETGPSPDGYAMGYLHAEGYRETPGCEVVACADLVPENARQFAEEFGLEPDRAYTSHAELCERDDPDVVSVCTPPHTHADIVSYVAQNSDVQAIHCEKPMALTWGDCRRMVECCRDEDVQLTFNVQRRFAGPYREAKALLDAGTVGEIRRIEVTGRNLYDGGIHWIDLAGYLNDEMPVQWVIAQIDYREENKWFGAHNENQSLVQWEYENGVYAVATTGEDNVLNDCHHRVVGTAGVVEVGREDGPALRVREHDDGEWRVHDCDGESCHAPDAKTPPLPGYVDRATAEVIDALDADRPSCLSAENVLRATEVTFAAWESSRRRGRIDLPLEITDNPLESMVEDGALDPQ